jgi:hypothetical protein
MTEDLKLEIHFTDFHTKQLFLQLLSILCDPSVSTMALFNVAKNEEKLTVDWVAEIDPSQIHIHELPNT